MFANRLFTKIAAAPLAALALCSAPAFAQEFSLGFSKHTRHGRFEVSIGSPGYGCDTYGGKFSHKKHWVPGHYEVRCEQVWVPGACQQIWHEPIYECRTTYSGHTYKVLVQDGWWETRQAPGHHQMVERKVWVPGYWAKY